MLPMPLMFSTPFSRQKEIGGKLIFVGRDAFKWTPDMLKEATFSNFRNDTPYIRINNYYDPKSTGFRLKDIDMSTMTNFNSAALWSFMTKMEAGPVKILLNRHGQRSVIRWKIPSK